MTHQSKFIMKYLNKKIANLYNEKNFKNSFTIHISNVINVVLCHKMLYSAIINITLITYSSSYRIVTNFLYLYVWTSKKDKQTENIRKPNWEYPNRCFETKPVSSILIFITPSKCGYLICSWIYRSLHILPNPCWKELLTQHGMLYRITTHYLCLIFLMRMWHDYN